MNDWKKDMLKAYEDTNIADVTVFGFLMNDGVDVYAVKVDKMPADFVVMSRETSKKGGVKKLKIGELNDKKRARLMEMGAQYVGNAAEIFGDAKNKGDAFESYIARAWYNVISHKKTSEPYWKRADVETETEKIQVKFEYATLANEQTIINGLNAFKH